MAQSREVMAFRKRLKKRGYQDVRIFSIPRKPGYFLVMALEPLAGMGVQCEMTEIDMLLWR